MQVAIYARVSTSRQADNDLSIPDQLRQLNDWAKANGHFVVQEYVEPGASATDDKRPVFQKMMTDALLKPAAFEMIVIHSLSRFFRDGIEFGVYERKLAKNKVKVVSITQPTSDDAGGEMMRRIICMFDEHQSKENSKHTSRAMKENARQGYFNGSRAPFGYRAEEADISGARGRKKKKLVIDESEAAVVRRIYDAYLNGLQGQVVGCKEIAKHLFETGILMRGKPWRMQKVQVVLSDPSYMGDYYFNMLDSKNRVMRPVKEWVKTQIPPIIDAATFERARLQRESRAPKQVAPRSLNCPTLLTGLLKCTCGAAMTVATGKGGRYKYYKCVRRQSEGNHACPSRSIPMLKMDEAVLRYLADTVFTVERLQVMVSELRLRLSSSKNEQQTRIAEIHRQIKQIEERKQRLMEAIETGVLELDEDTQRRSQQLKTAREALFIDLANVRQTESPAALDILKPQQVTNFGQVLREKLLAPNSAIAKSYLNLMVDEIVVKNNAAHITGSYAAIADAMSDGKSGLKSVPTFNLDWRAQHYEFGHWKLRRTLQS